MLVIFLQLFSARAKVHRSKYGEQRQALLKQVLSWLATLLEGVNNKFFKVNFKKYILFKNGCFKAVKLVKKVILVINGVSTIYLWTKNEEKRPILSVFSENSGNVGKNNIFVFLARSCGHFFISNY